MEQNIVIAIDHSAEAEQAVKCELRGVHIKVEGRGMTNYPIGPHRDPIGPLSASFYRFTLHLGHEA